MSAAVVLVSVIFVRHYRVIVPGRLTLNRFIRGLASALLHYLNRNSKLSPEVVGKGSIDKRPGRLYV